MSKVKLNVHVVESERKTEKIVTLVFRVLVRLLTVVRRYLTSF